jgi:chromosome segregation ATPase
MIRPGRSTRYNAAAGNTGSDTDALQTDVMRFMSILGLCLMAVFALVQSLPLQETDAVRPEPEGEELHKVIAIQQQHAQALAAELERLITQIEQAQASKADAQQALSAAERELKQVVDQTQQARSEQQHLTVELDSLQQQLARVRYALAALQQAADDKAQSLSALEQRLGQEKKRLDEIRQRTHEVKMQLARIRPRPLSRDGFMKWPRQRYHANTSATWKHQSAGLHGHQSSGVYNYPPQPNAVSPP